MTVYTVELQAHTGSGVETFYAASDAYNTGATDLPANQHFHPSLEVPANFERALFSGGTSGLASIGFGEIVLVNAHGRYDAWPDYAFDGRPCIVKAIVIDADTGLPVWAYKDTPVLIRGTVESVDVTDAFKTIKLRLYDRLADLDKPLLTTRYAGTTISAGLGAEGTEDLKDTIKPRIYGQMANVVPVDVNPFDLVRQVSDKACSAITVYDGGLALTNAGNSADLAALVAATIAPGEYRTCLALGLFRLGGSPAFAITADVTASGASDAAGIVEQMLLDFGVFSGELDAASFTALTTKNSAVCGIWIEDDRSALSAATEVLRSIGGWLIPDGEGVFFVGRLDLPTGTPIAVFSEWQCRGEVERLSPANDTAIPAYRVVVRFKRLGRSQEENDLAGGVTATRKAALAMEWRSAVAEDATVKDRFLLAQEMTFDTCLQDAAAATAEAQRLLAIYKVRREVWRIRVDMSNVDYRVDPDDGDPLTLSIGLGSVVQLGLSRFLNPPALFLVIGRIEDCVANRIQFDLWK